MINISEKNTVPILSVMFLAVAVLYSFSQIFFGLDLTDSFYYLHFFKSEDLSLSVTGFQLIGRIWVTLFGETIVSLRIANWLFYSIAFVLAYLWFIPKQDHIKYLPLLAFPFLLLPTFSLNIFNGDSCTVLVVVCLVKVLTRRISCPDWKSGIILCILLWIAAFLRFPNIVATVLTLIPVLFFASTKGVWMKYSLIAVIAVILYALMQFLALQYAQTSLIADLSDGDGSHSIANLVEKYWRDAKTILSFLPLCLIVLLTCLDTKLSRPWDLLLSAVAVLYFAFWLKCEVNLGFACYTLSLFYSSFVSSVCLLCIYKSLASGRDWLLPLTVLVMSFVNPAGSDTGLLKLSLALVAFLPALLACFRSYVANRTLLVLIVGALTIFSLYAHYQYPFGEPSIPSLTYRINNEKVGGIRTSAAQFGLYEAAKCDVDSLGKDNIVIYGELSHGLNELLEITPVEGLTFFMDAENDADVDAVRSYVVLNAPSVIFMPYKPDGAKAIFNNRSDLTKMEDMLLSEGYFVSKKTDYYYIYSPASGKESSADDSNRI